MLPELFELLRTPATPFARKIGYHKELIAINARFKRNRAYWRLHLEKTRETITRACEKSTSHNCVVVIGAGSLLDIPIFYLEESFEKVYLLDVVFSRKVINLARKISNVELITHDINGLDVNMGISKKNKSIPGINASLPEAIVDPDIVISANILSQLPLLPIRYFHKLGINEQTLYEFGRNIIESHLNLLANLECKSCLVTDKSRIISQDEDKIETESALFDVALPEANEQWLWQLAPAGEIDPGSDISAEVVAFYDYKAA